MFRVNRCLFAYLLNGQVREQAATKITVSDYDEGGEAYKVEVVADANIAWKTLTLDIELVNFDYEIPNDPTLSGDLAGYYDMIFNKSGNIYKFIISDRDVDTNETLGIKGVVTISLKRKQTENKFDLTIEITKVQ